MPQAARDCIGFQGATKLRALARRCGHPGQQHGRFFPSSTSSCSRARRLARVGSCLAEIVQQIHSLRASGVSACHFAASAASLSSNASSSGGSACRKSGSAGAAIPGQAACASSRSMRSQFSTSSPTCLFFTSPFPRYCPISPIPSSSFFIFSFLFFFLFLFFFFIFSSFFFFIFFLFFSPPTSLPFYFSSLFSILVVFCICCFFLLLR